MTFPTNALVRWALILTALWLVGCTTYVQTQVTAFSDWSGNDTTRTYAFARKGEQQNSIEQTTYETLVANELSKYNFSQAPEASANYQVAIAYSVRGDTMTVRQPVYYDPWPMYGGPWGGPSGVGRGAARCIEARADRRGRSTRAIRCISTRCRSA